MSYEFRDINSGLKAIDNYVKLNNQLSSSELGNLFSRNLKIKFEILIGQKDEAKKELEETIKMR